MKFCFLLFLCLGFNISAQIAPFVDFSGYFNTFYKGNYRTLEFQRISSFQAGDSILPYIDGRGNFKIYNGDKIEQISIQQLTYKNSDYLVAWKIGSSIFSYDHGEKKMLTINGGDFIVTDSLIVFQDTRFKTLNVYYRNEVFQLMQQTGEMFMPDAIGENIIGFKDNGDVYRIFWRGKITELGGTSLGIVFSASTDIICFNDMINKTFSVFDEGEFVDVEQMFVKKYKAGRGYILYEDQNGNLFKYQLKEKINISNYSNGVWDLKDDVFVWNENALFFTNYLGEKIEISNYTPKEFEIKNNLIAYRNSIGGVNVFWNGKNYTVTNQIDASFKIFGKGVLVELMNSSFIYFSEGNSFQN